MSLMHNQYGIGQRVSHPHIQCSMYLYCAYLCVLEDLCMVVLIYNTHTHTHTHTHTESRGAVDTFSVNWYGESNWNSWTTVVHLPGVGNNLVTWLNVWCSVVLFARG